MNTRFYICDPLPLDAEREVDFILDTQLGILWEFDDEGNGSVKEWLAEPIEDESILDESARLAGEAFVSYIEEEE